MAPSLPRYLRLSSAIVTASTRVMEIIESVSQPKSSNILAVFLRNSSGSRSILFCVDST